MIVLKKKGVNRYFGKNPDDNWFCQIEYFDTNSKFTIKLERRGMTSREEAEEVMEGLLEMIGDYKNKLTEAIQFINEIETKI